MNGENETGEMANLTVDHLFNTQIFVTDSPFSCKCDRTRGECDGLQLLSCVTHALV